MLRSFALSPTQQAMLYYNVATPGSGAYIQHAVCDVAERVDVRALERAWHAVVARHAPLRMAFRLDATDGPVQDVHDSVDTSVAVEDWRGLSSDAQARAFEARVDADRADDFAAERAPLWRLALLHLADARFRVVFTYHHALLDGRATRVVLRELFDAYDAFVAERAFDLPPAAPFDEHVRWLASQPPSAAQRYWESALAGFTGPTSLASPHARAGAPRDYGAHELRFSHGRTEALAAFAREHGVTLNTLVLGAWAQLLNRYGGDDAVAFGVTVSLRGAGPPAFRDMVGPLLNTVPMRVRIAPHATLASWLVDLRSQWLALRAHAWASAAQIRQWCGLPRDVPLLDNLVVFERTPLDAALADERPAWTTRRFSRRGGAGHPLTLVAFGEPALSLKLVYERSRFDAWTIEPMLEHLRNLLDAMPAGHAMRLREQKMLSPDEERRLVVDWNRTARTFRDDGCVHALVSKAAQDHPDAIAVEGKARTLTHAELDKESSQLAAYLVASGVGAGALVGLCVDRSPSLVVAMLGILKAGAAYVPLDPAYPDPRIAAIAADASLATIVTTSALAPRFRELPHATLVKVDDYDARTPPAAAPRPAPVSMADPAYAVYTSGSTGAPKGIVVSHAALANHTLDLVATYAITPADRRLQFVSLGSDVLIADVFPVLAAGGAVVLRPDEGLPTITAFLRFLDEQRITMAGLPSGYWHEWVDAMMHGEMRFPRALRIVTSGMDAARPDLLREWRSRAPRHVRWFNAYGPSETTGTATRYEAGTLPHEFGGSIPIGRPIANVRVHIVDPLMRPVPAGVPGEIVIGGRGVADGYLNQPALTAERFVPDPFAASASDRVYRSGDVGRYLPDGTIEFLGRADEQVKIRGFRVEPREVEASLLRLPGVRDAAVVAAGTGLERRRLVAYVVADWTRTHGAAELRGHLRAWLPDYMLPAQFVVLAAIPRTAEGKLDRSALPEAAPRKPAARQTSMGAGDPLEYMLVDLWERLLKTRVGLRDSFFDLGGDSLVAVQMMESVARIVGFEVPLTTLFAEATVARLAIALKASAASAAQVVAAVNAGSARPPFLFLHGDYSGGGFYCRGLAVAIGSDQPFYAIHPHGIDRTAVPPTIEAMAEERLVHVRNTLPRGPYLLGGYCAGGLVALEMARRLKADGEDVPVVVIIDAKAPLRRKLVFSSDGSSRSTLPVAAASSTALFRNDVTAAYVGPIAQYDPAPYAGRVVVLKSALMRDFRQHLGWAMIASDVDSASIPGDHFAAITRYAPDLGATLRRYLDGALQR